ncbi:hypothetical protein LAZ67_1001762 [Cordylochernes scorpioides]|uniref:Mos1 transposase HTH domain-containing protein n=1 Tax=Cordylochernes scorpioides TaxID=51811 RepID=A0ABY6JVP7_9ARAC|nr:hypothetical protein LAZ67_1001762 [Cordylochernes scorpioides]
MSIQMVRRWRSWFLEGRQNVHDDERSDRPVTATDNAAVAAVRNVVEANRRVTIDEIMIRLPPGIEIGCSSIGEIMRRRTTGYEDRTRLGTTVVSKNRYNGTKNVWTEMIGSYSCTCLKITFINNKIYCKSLEKLKRAISTKWLGLKGCQIKFHQDNARPHTAQQILAQIFRYGWILMPHPAYSPDLAPSDFYLFGKLKNFLPGRTFENDEMLLHEFRGWLRNQDVAFYQTTFVSWKKRWTNGVQREGKTAFKSFQMLKQAFKEDSLTQSRTFEWFARFKAGRTSVKDDLHTGKPLSIRNPENALKIKSSIKENPIITIIELSEDLDISFGTCQPS